MTPQDETLIEHLTEEARDLASHLMKEQITWLIESGFAKDDRQAMIISNLSAINLLMLSFMTTKAVAPSVVPDWKEFVQNALRNMP